MKIFNFILFVLLLSMINSCNNTFENPNNPTEETVFSSTEGVVAVCIGIRQLYSGSILWHSVYVPGITSREIGVTNTYQSSTNLAQGGSALDTDNVGITSLWSNCYKGLKMIKSANDALQTLDIPDDDNKSYLLAFTDYFKALICCNLYQSFEKFPLEADDAGNAEFSDRGTALDNAISILLTSYARIENINTSDLSTSTNSVYNEMNLKNSIAALLSRLYLYKGDYTNCQTYSDNVDLTATSYYTYDNDSKNPIYNYTVNASNAPYRLPQDNFGLTGSYIPSASDGRIAFYLVANAMLTAHSDAGNFPCENIKGFFETASTKIPTFLPGEILLNKAEAYARADDLTNAVTELDKVITKSSDAYGLNANLPSQSVVLSSLSKENLLDTIYKHRCIELFYTGQRLNDSRRFHPDALNGVTGLDYTTERNRNYYAYPQTERDNNSNCPADPAI